MIGFRALWEEDLKLRDSYGKAERTSRVLDMRTGQTHVLQLIQGTPELIADRSAKEENDSVDGVTVRLLPIVFGRRWLAVCLLDMGDAFRPFRVMPLTHTPGYLP